MRQYDVTALKDEARILGLVLAKGARVSIDVEDSRVCLLQAAVDSGDVEVVGMKVSPPPAPEKKGK